MSSDHLKDSMLKTYGIRSGEPKRPESLIEMQSVVPEVPEVSLCFNQEKKQSLQSNRASPHDVGGRVLDHHHGHYQNEVLQRNERESYNTWKAKNAQALHNITGGMEKTELRSKRTPSIKSAGLRRQNSGNEMYSPPIIAPKYHINEPLKIGSSTSQNHPGGEYNPSINVQQKMSASNQPSNTYPVDHHSSHPIRSHNFPHHHIRDYQQNEESMNKPSGLPSNLQNHYSCKDKTVENVPYGYKVNEKSNHNSNPVFNIPGYCNNIQCPCGKPNLPLNSSTGNQFFNGNPVSPDDLRANMQFNDVSKLYLPFEHGSINNHMSSISHIINIQKEQISMLCQEMSTQKMIMSALLKEVKQIHTAVSQNAQTAPNCDMHSTGTESYQFHEHKNEQNLRNEIRGDSMNSQTERNGNPTDKQLPKSPNVETRSVGVMTSSLEQSVKTSVSCNERKKPQEVKNDEHKSIKQHQKPKTFNSTPQNKYNVSSKKSPTHRESKKKSQSDHTQRRKNRKEESNESSGSEDSFSLDEDAIVVREAEQEESPDESIHVNMPKCSLSSTESSDPSDSSDSEGGESSDPQIGWTFYDRVVGQVNNMLKKTSNDPRQEYAQSRRRDVGNVLYQCNEDYETENNWSKRVTFDGPPLEDSDNNGMTVPRYYHCRGNQDYRMPGGQERVQDFMMCDMAGGGNNLSLVNGSTNVSFATYRYYQRHQLLPPPPPDRVFDSVQTRKKNKARKSEKTNPTPPKSHKKKNGVGGPPSKILDMSQQPKLF